MSEMTVIAGTPERDDSTFVKRKGAKSRERILACAADLARVSGLGATSFGRVADAAHLSKSAVVKHFGTHTRLQQETVHALACAFRGDVLAPTDDLKGSERLRTLYSGFLGWMGRGCPLVAVSLISGGLSEPLRARAANALAAWRRTLCDAITDAVQRGELEASIDVEQVCFELTGAGCLYRQEIASAGAEAASGRAWRAFERCLPPYSASPSGPSERSREDGPGR